MAIFNNTNRHIKYDLASFFWQFWKKLGNFLFRHLVTLDYLVGNRVSFRILSNYLTFVSTEL